MQSSLPATMEAKNTESGMAAPKPGWDGLWINANLATMEAGEKEPYGAIAQGAIAVADGRIAWRGAMADLRGGAAAAARGAGTLFDAGGRWITPGLIDCHSHFVFGGNRAGEFEQRLNGVSYEAIARAGGGINATVTATREADEDSLYAAALPRLKALLGEGVTVVEIKSGYGLDIATEIKMLRVARRLGRDLPVEVRTSFLGAHAVPPEYRGRADAYIDLVCDEMLPAVAASGLADAVDGFCDEIGFSAAQMARVFAAAARHALPVKLHADQLSDAGAAALAAAHGALSADHLEYAGAAGIDAMARAGTVAVLLPGAFYTLREDRLPPIERMRDKGVAMAVASDFNPGSSPAPTLLLMLNMACTLFRLTPEEALAGVTRHAARALGLAGVCGELAPGRRADFALWDIDHPAELAYWVGYNPCAGVVRAGRPVPAPG
jgi:imidazolonepropionase